MPVTAAPAEKAFDRVASDEQPAIRGEKSKTPPTAKSRQTTIIVAITVLFFIFLK